MEILGKDFDMLKIKMKKLILEEYKSTVTFSDVFCHFCLSVFISLSPTVCPSHPIKLSF